MRASIGLAGTRITTLRWKGGPVFKDACAIIPLSLEKASTIAGVPLQKETGLTCERRGPCRSKDCGGYCRIKRKGMSKGERASLSKYLKLDCTATLAVVCRVLEEFELSGYIAKNTIGGTAYATAKKVCGFEDADWDSATYHLVEEAKYGGRSECYRPRADRLHGHDLVNAYPDALRRTPLPVGKRVVITGKRAARAFRRGKEGIYSATVFIPDMHIPPLPVRVDEGHRIIFPIGRAKGAWTRIELQHAIDAGCKVLRWGRAVVWAEAVTLIKPFVDMVWARRKLAQDAKNPGLYELHKLVGNSFTGKCGQSPEMERVLFNPPPEALVVCDATDCAFADRERCTRQKRRRCCIHRCRRSCGATRQIGLTSKVYTAKFYRIADCAHVHWNAYLTAATRIEWRIQALADGKDGWTLAYGDTDSVFSTSRRTRRAGTDLGEWKYEGALVDWRCIAPKVYRYEREMPEGFYGPRVLVTKAKGLPDLDGPSWDDFAAGVKVPRQRGVYSLKRAAQGSSLFARKKIVRQSHADGIWFGGRRLGDDGLTHAVTVKEFQDGQKARKQERDEL